MISIDSTIDITCRSCREVVPVSVSLEDYTRWQLGGGLIQNVMPYLSADDRELLISGTCSSCWDAMFGDE